MPQPAATADSYVARKIQQAKSLEKRRAELQDEISANRRQLRDMDKTGDLTAEQANWLEDFYPTKERGASRSKDDITATRKAKEAARKAA